MTEKQKLPIILDPGNEATMVCMTCGESWPAVFGEAYHKVHRTELKPEVVNALTNIFHESGGIVTHPTGAKREPAAARYSAIPVECLRRLAARYSVGEAKYGKDNWKRGLPIDDVLDHMFEHLMQYIDGKRDEDHLAAVAWGAFTLMWYQERHMGEEWEAPWAEELRLKNEVIKHALVYEERAMTDTNDNLRNAVRALRDYQRPKPAGQ